MTHALDAVLAYHERTKHQFHRYAAGPGGLDWNSQPNPFRRYAGSPQRELPLAGNSVHPRYVDLCRPRALEPQALSLYAIAALLELSLGLSAWKQHGSERWALRCNPSSGNLHPTEGYLVIAGVADIEDGVYHYVSQDHRLEQRCRMRMTPAEREHFLPRDSFLVGLSSIHWREAWKYGERAYRYCQHDAGHAIAAVRYAAAALGWRARMLTSWSDADIGTVLGLDRDADFGAAEREQPDAMLLVTAGRAGAGEGDVDPDQCVHAVGSGQWHGQANVLSSHHRHDWPAIDEVARACTKPRTPPARWQAPVLPAPVSSDCALSAGAIIRQRRSAQAFDGVTILTAPAFHRMLDLTLPRPGTPPWDALDHEPRVHLALFAHRIEGLAPGLYLFVRNEHREDRLRAELAADFEWMRVPDCPAHLRLFRLVAGDARAAARTLSCHQDIAADGAVSLGMLAEFDTSLAPAPWVYRQLFREAGLLGHVLYLEAECAGVRGTGIGCYFDDAVHELLGLKTRAFQSLYHFTLGGALTDARLQTLPPYAHLKR